LSTKIIFFSYPKLLSFSVLTFIKWRLKPSYAAKDTIFWKKDPKLSLSELLYWIISTENDHRHHHKFIKYEKRLRKEGKTCSAYLSNKICATSARVWTRSTSFISPSMWTRMSMRTA
jgi:hypothetical protein